MTSTFIARSCVALLYLSARIGVPRNLDRTAARVAVWFVKTYQKFLSSKTGRTCLFRVSCSQATLNYLDEHGWNEGIIRSRARVRSCGGAYTLSTDVFGHARLTTADGNTFRHEELSVALQLESRVSRPSHP